MHRLVTIAACCCAACAAFAPAVAPRVRSAARLSAEREPWEAGRFARTLLAFRPRLFGGRGGGGTAQHSAGVELFSSAADWAAWQSLDDVVMGGVSKSSLAPNPAGPGAVFAGTVKTSNNGGFAGVRTRNIAPALDMRGLSGLALTVRDAAPRRYKIVVRSDTKWDGYGWTGSFDTSGGGKLTTVKVPFESLKPVFRAKTVTADKPLDVSSIVSFQIAHSKFEYDDTLNPMFEAGEFSLAIEGFAPY